ncbi:hypothetical protein IMZ48_01595 [Candidatus Bathyarchaeota archaeon]|nr:hypothetical protein [Candidatus Bathyarchaeota archaeon]
MGHLGRVNYSYGIARPTLRPRFVGVLGWLLTCRGAYLDTVDVLYGHNTLHISRMYMFLGFPRLFMPDRLSAIRQVELLWDFGLVAKGSKRLRSAPGRRRQAVFSERIATTRRSTSSMTSKPRYRTSAPRTASAANSPSSKPEPAPRKPRPRPRRAPRPSITTAARAPRPKTTTAARVERPRIATGRRQPATKQVSYNRHVSNFCL